MLVGTPGKTSEIINIATLTTRCIRLLAEADSNRKRRSLSEGTQTALDDLQYMFRVWVGNVGVFASGPGSTDNRLEDDKEIGDAVMFALARLGSCIYDIVQPTLLDIPESDDELVENIPTTRTLTEPIQQLSKSDCDLQEQASTSDLDSSESSLTPEPSSDGDSDRGEATTLPRIDGDVMLGKTQRLAGPVDILIQKANKMVDRLYKLASVLRKPISASEDTRVQAFLRKHRNDKDVAELLDHDALKTSATFQINFRNNHRRLNDPQFKPIPEELVKRLVETILLRRSKLIYRQRHQEKLRAGTSDAFRQFNQTQHSNHPVNMEHTDEAPTMNVDSQSQQPGYSPEFKNLQPLGVDFQHRFERSKAAPSAMYSATLASSVDRGRFAGPNAKSVVMSRISPSTAERQLSLGVRAPPLSEGREGKTECPVCFKLISNKEVEDSKYWTRHLLKDIQPYVCLFRDCRSPSMMYSVPDDWLRHLQSHTSAWCCEVPGHEQEVFDSPDEFESHLKEHHTGLFTEKQLLILIERGERIVDDPFIQLGFEYDNSYSFETEQRHVCPLCWEYSDGPQEDHPSRSHSRNQPAEDIYQHILAHLESWALLSLPDSVNVDDIQSSLLRESQESVARSRTTLASYKRNLPNQGWEDSIDESTLVGQDSKEIDSSSQSNLGEDFLIGAEPPELESEEPWDFYYNDQNTQIRVPDPDEDSLLLRWSARMEKPPSQSQSERAKELDQICSWLFPEPKRPWHSFAIPQAATEALSGPFESGYWFCTHPNFLYWFHSTVKSASKTAAISEDADSRILLCHGRKSRLRTTNNAMICRYLKDNATGTAGTSAGNSVGIIPVYLDFGPNASSNEDALEVIIRYILRELTRSLVGEILPAFLEASQKLTNDDSGMDGRWGLSAVTDLAISILGEFGSVFICIDSQLDEFHQLDAYSVLEWAMEICERCSNVRFLIHGYSEIYNLKTVSEHIDFSSTRQSFSDSNLDWCYRQWFLASNEGDITHNPPFCWYDVLEEAILRLLEEYESWKDLGPNTNLMRLHYKEIGSSRHKVLERLSINPNINTVTESIYFSVLAKISRQTSEKSDQAFYILSLLGLARQKSVGPIQGWQNLSAYGLLDLLDARLGASTWKAPPFKAETDPLKREQLEGIEREHASELLAAIQACLGLVELFEKPRLLDKIDLAKDDVVLVHPSLTVFLRSLVYARTFDSVSESHELVPQFERAQLQTIEAMLRYLLHSSGLWVLPPTSEMKMPRDFLNALREKHPALYYVAYEWGARFDHSKSIKFKSELPNRSHTSRDSDSDSDIITSITSLLDEVIARTRAQGAKPTPFYLTLRLSQHPALLEDDPIKPPPFMRCIKRNLDYDPGFTLTHVAASFCSVKLMEYLDRSGLVELYQQDNAGLTPLVHALLSSRKDEEVIYMVVEWILRKLDLPESSQHQRSLNKAIPAFTTQKGLVALRCAFNRRMLKVMAELLKFCTVEVWRGDSDFGMQMFDIFVKAAQDLSIDFSTRTNQTEDSLKFNEEVLLLFISLAPCFRELWREYTLLNSAGSKFHISGEFPSERVVRALIDHGLLGPRNPDIVGEQASTSS